MKFQEFLDSIEEFDGEVIVSNLFESNFSFVWDDKIKLTEEGKKRFSELLNSEVKFSTKNGGTVILQDKSIKEAQYILFMESVAGHVSSSLYNKWFSVKR